MFDMRKRSVRWVALVLALGVTACSPGATAERMLEEAIEAETGGEIDLDVDSGTVTIRGKDGEAITFAGDEGRIELPDDFPSTIPVYPDAQAIQYTNMGNVMRAGFLVDEAATDVRNWYVEQLEDQGWEIQTNVATPDYMLISAELEGETLSLMLGVAENEPTTIVISLTRD